MNAPLLARLRTDTQSRHAILDARLGADLLRSRESYLRFLQASLRAVRGVERAVEQTLGAEEFPALRARLLEEDLAALDAAPRGEDLPALALRSEAAAFGAAYVVEGSALGGQVLAARVRNTLGEEISTRYLGLRGSETGTRWRWFMGELARFADPADSAAAEEASAAAIAVFDRYLGAF